MSIDSKKEAKLSASGEAAKTALACSVAVWITYTYAWPDPFWSCIAILISRQMDRSPSWLLVGKQSGGVVLGTFIGTAALTVSQDALLFCLLLAFFTWAVAYRCAVDPPSPFWLFAGFTATTIATAGLFQNNPEVRFALPRGADLLLGVFLATTVSLRPNWNRDFRPKVATGSDSPGRYSHRLARQHAWRVVLATFATLATWLWFDIPAGAFAMVATSLMATSAVDSAAVRFSQRLIGISVGACLAIAFIVMLLPLVERIQEFVLLIFGIFWVCGLINYRSQSSAVAGLQSSITFALVLLRDAHQSSDLLPVWQRSRALAIGLIISFLVIDGLTRRATSAPRTSSTAVIQ